MLAVPCSFDADTPLTKQLQQRLKLQRPDSLRLLAVSRDAQGGRHALLQQTRWGIPVFGAWYNIHERSGQLSSARGRIYSGQTASVAPLIGEGAALETAMGSLSASHFAWQNQGFELALKRQQNDSSATFFPSGELVLLPNSLLEPPKTGGAERLPTRPDSLLLAWRFDLLAVAPRLERALVFVDASNGRLLLSLSSAGHCRVPAQGKAAYIPAQVSFSTDSCTASMGCRYRLRDPERSIAIFNANNNYGTPSIEVCHDSTLWLPEQADTAAVAAMYGLKTWYDYFANSFGWYGLTGEAGVPVQAWVHYGNNFENAIYNVFLLFGDGNSDGVWKQPLVQQDIVAHEATHGFIEHSANLLYLYESGILNEAIADIFACLVEGNWQLGERIIPGGIRRLDAPALSGLPDTYQGDFWIEQSWPGQALHHNSTVFGHWFYLLSEGKSGVNDHGTFYEVGGIDRESAAELLFHTLRFHFLNPNDGFYGARMATMEAASDLHWSQAAIEELAMAWCAVGVGPCSAQVADSLALLAPNGGGSYAPGDTILLAWENTPGVSQIAVTFQASPGGDAQEIASFSISGNSGSQFIAAPQVNSHLCQIRITSMDNPLVFDYSDSTFSIIGCSLLADFTVSPQQACLGADFTVVNTSFYEEADFEWWLDGQQYPAPSEGFSLDALTAGEHQLQLVADNGLCRDTLARSIKVMPLPSAEFHYALSNQVITAAAASPYAGQYIWYVDGQLLPEYEGAPQVTWSAPGSGTYELCLFIDGDCLSEGVEYCQNITVAAGQLCEGESETWHQYNNTSEVIDMAEYGDTLLLSTSGGLVFFDKTSQQVVNVLNTVSNPALPCQGLGSIAVDRSRKWCYVALQEEEGFVRLDVEANTVTHFNKWNLPELPSDAIQAMRVDAQGDLWIGSADQGLWVGVPGLSFSASFTSELPEQAIVDIAFAPDGATWVAMKNSTAKIVGGALTEVYLPTDSPLPPAPVPGINAVMADESGLWVGAKNGLHRLQDGEWQTFDADDFGGSSSVVTSIAAGQNGRVFVGLQLNSQMLVYDGEAWDAIDCLGSPYGEVGQIMRLVKDEARLWAGCAYGLYAWDETLGCQSIPTASFPIFRNRIENLLISSNAVYAIEEQSIARINGTEAEGLDIASYLPFGPSYLPFLELFKMAEGADGSLWVALDFYEYRLARYLPAQGSWQFFSEAELPFSENITDLSFAQGDLYLANEEGVFIFHTASGQWTLQNEGNSPIGSTGGKMLVLDPQDNIWLSSTSMLSESQGTNQLLQWDGGQWASLLIDADGVDAFTFEEDGTLWLAAWNTTNLWPQRKIWRYQDGEWALMQAPSDLLNDARVSCTDIELGPAGNIWIATFGMGLLKVGPQGDVLEHFTACNSGLIDNEVYDIEIHATEGEIWAATEEGISRFAPGAEFITPAFHTEEEVCAGTVAHFVNTTTGAANWEWKVNGFTVSTEKNLSYTFTKSGVQLVELKAYNAQGCAVAQSHAITVHPKAKLPDWPSSIIKCESAYELCAPAGMAAYQWKNGPHTVGTERCYRVEQPNSGTYELTVVDHCGAEKSILLEVRLSGTCVYPGDSNGDGIVDFRDLLWVGYTFGQHGPERASQSINWKAYPALPWQIQLPNGTNIKHCDANGDGQIDLFDISAIVKNYLYARGNPPALPAAQPSPYHFKPVLLAVDSSLGDQQYRLTVGILAQHEEGAAMALYGAGMRLYYALPPGMELLETPSFSFGPAASGLSTANLVKVYEDLGFLDVAYTRLDHQNHSQAGLLGSAQFVVVDDHLPILDSLYLAVNLVGSTAITNEGNFIPLGSTQQALYFGQEDNISHGNEQESVGQMLVFPNPTTGRCRIKLPHSPAREVAIQVLNAQQTEVLATVSTGQALVRELDLSGLPAGMYFIVVRNGTDIYIQRIVKL